MKTYVLLAALLPILGATSGAAAGPGLRAKARTITGTERTLQNDVPMMTSIPTFLPTETQTECNPTTEYGDGWGEGYIQEGECYSRDYATTTTYDCDGCVEDSRHYTYYNNDIGGGTQTIYATYGYNRFNCPDSRRNTCEIYLNGVSCECDNIVSCGNDPKGIATLGTKGGLQIRNTAEMCNHPSVINQLGAEQAAANIYVDDGDVPTNISTSSPTSGPITVNPTDGPTFSSPTRKTDSITQTLSTMLTFSFFEGKGKQPNSLAESRLLFVTEEFFRRTLLENGALQTTLKGPGYLPALEAIEIENAVFDYVTSDSTGENGSRDTLVVTFDTSITSTILAQKSSRIPCVEMTSCPKPDPTFVCEESWADVVCGTTKDCRYSNFCFARSAGFNPAEECSRPPPDAANYCPVPLSSITYSAECDRVVCGPSNCPYNNADYAKWAGFNVEEHCTSVPFFVDPPWDPQKSDCAEALQTFRASEGLSHTWVRASCFQDNQCHIPTTAIPDIPCRFSTTVNNSQWEDCSESWSSYTKPLGLLASLLGTDLTSENAAVFANFSVPNKIKTNKKINVSWGLAIDCDGYVYLLFAKIEEGSWSGDYQLVGFEHSDKFLGSTKSFNNNKKATVWIESISGIDEPEACPYGHSEEQSLVGTCQLSLMQNPEPTIPPARPTHPTLRSLAKVLGEKGDWNQYLRNCVKGKNPNSNGLVGARTVRARFQGLGNRQRNLFMIVADADLSL